MPGMRNTMESRHLRSSSSLRWAFSISRNTFVLFDAFILERIVPLSWVFGKREGHGRR